MNANCPSAAAAALIVTDLNHAMTHTVTRWWNVCVSRGRQLRDQIGPDGLGLAQAVRAIGRDRIDTRAHLGPAAARDFPAG